MRRASIGIAIFAALAACPSARPPGDSRHAAPPLAAPTHPPIVVGGRAPAPPPVPRHPAAGAARAAGGAGAARAAGGAGAAGAAGAVAKPGAPPLRRMAPPALLPAAARPAAHPEPTATSLPSPLVWRRMA
ncbi:MAG TPA: hypothetical protein VNJ51_09600 [Candidatus Dormibacteraeota bacterium]|nr:hypothetical protein [Candidatus Dormibacteraeota bacterium]